MRQAVLPLALLVLVWWLYTASSLDDLPDGADAPLPWTGESPHWVDGQPFSAVQDAAFIGSAECLYCHPELKAAFMNTAHARSLNDDKMPLEQQGCEACHGAGGAHAVLQSRGAIFAFDWSDPALTNRVCMRCHNWLTSGGEWSATTHAKARLTCTQCHDPHVPKDPPYRFLLRDQQDRLCVGCHEDIRHELTGISKHPIYLENSIEAGSQTIHCTSCHDVHAGKGRAMLTERRKQDTCLSCHIDKGGPFRFVHMATEEGFDDGCLACHAPHGSNNQWLLKADGRELCLRCHTDREDHNQPLTCWTTGCHTAMHGSQSDLLFRE
jgi:DmsE family decaheme c-type cytochrome